MSDKVACVIVGGGAAGLTAGLYLARFRHRVIVLDDGRSRLRMIPRSRNVPGFPDGIEGEAFHDRLQQQAERFGCTLVTDRVQWIDRNGDDFRVFGRETTFSAKAVIMATGVAVTDPALASLAKAVSRGVIRYCPVCDGFEVRQRNIAVLGNHADAIEEAFFLRDYSDRVTFLSSDRHLLLPDQHLAEAQRRGIAIESRILNSLHLVPDGLAARLSDGSVSTFDTLYPSLGNRPRSELAAMLGAEVTPGGGVLVDSRQQTNVPMLYAASDVLEGLDQIASACGQAAIAATAIHNHLRRTL